MLLTRSIRRQFALGLGLLLLMICLLSVGSLSGLSNYRRMVRELELSLDMAPRNSELVASIGLLIMPLSQEISVADEAAPLRQRAYRIQQKDCEKSLGEVRTLVDHYFAQLDAFYAELDLNADGLREVRQERQAYYNLRDDLDKYLRDYELQVPLLSNLNRRSQTSELTWRGMALQYMTRVVGEAIAEIRKAPEPANNLQLRLDNARRDYRVHLSVVWVTSAIGLLLFFGLMVCAFRWVVLPIKALHRGALRVADGDFDYRLEVSSNDEISQLAEAFNHMTERFQSIKNELDEQVHQQTRQLVQSAKLAGVGFLASGVAHEINNPLQAIATAAEALEYRLHEVLDQVDPVDARTIREYLQMMQVEAERCREITWKLLDFARGKESERNLYDMTAIVREVVGMVQHVARFRDRTITFDTHKPHYAWVNGSEIKQVVLNVVANALEATNPGGAVTLSLRECPDSILLTCRDTGVGMTPEVLEHLFEPFFTTKQGGKGTGLGLSISHRIVQDHDGVLEATSDGPGHGSTFRLRLPRRAPTNQQAA